MKTVSESLIVDDCENVWLILNPRVSLYGTVGLEFRVITAEVVTTASWPAALASKIVALSEPGAPETVIQRTIDPGPIEVIDEVRAGYRVKLYTL